VRNLTPICRQLTQHSDNLLRKQRDTCWASRICLCRRKRREKGIAFPKPASGGTTSDIYALKTKFSCHCPAIALEKEYRDLHELFTDGDRMMYLKDLVLTDTFLLKGHISSGGQRLSSFLNGIPKRFLEMNEATVTDLLLGARFTNTRMLLRVEEIILAHELVEKGDESLRLLAAQERDEITATARFSGPTPLVASGRVSRRALEHDTPGQHEFIVISEPSFEGLTGIAQDAFKNLPYVIANRGRIAFIYES
jgi:hypothetical protein